METTGTILLIDQDSELAQIMGSFFTTLGFRVLHTTRVREALKKLSNQKFAFIFVDPELKPDTPETLFAELMDPASLNHKTPLIVSSLNAEAALPMAVVKRID
jgi:DNA-binding NtrC family response regulator